MSTRWNRMELTSPKSNKLSVSIKREGGELSSIIESDNAQV